MSLQISLILGDPVPTSLGECADALGVVRDTRLKMERDAEAVKKREDEIENHLIAVMTQQKQMTAGGSRNDVERKPTRTVRITDWSSLVAWVARTGKSEVLYKRVNAKAALEIEEFEHELPTGTEAVNGEKLSVTKAGAAKRGTSLDGTATLVAHA
jgi:hypothetical protein